MADRRQFKLSSADEAVLNRLGRRWEALAEPGKNWIIVYGYAPPHGFVQTSVDMALWLQQGYPAVEIDMAYFSPALSMPSNRVINRTQVTMMIDGRQWQRWSRHRQPGGPAWNPGEDSLETHLEYVDMFLNQELERGL